MQVNLKSNWNLGLACNQTMMSVQLNGIMGYHSFDSPNKLSLNSD